MNNNSMGVDTVNEQAYPDKNIADLEAAVLALCEELLARPVDPTENFFHSGGDSLLAMVLISLLEDDLGISIEIDAVYEAEDMGSIAKLAATCRPL